MTSTAAETERQLLSDIDHIDRNRRMVRRWLGVVLLTLFALVLVGGATRLTESGLSITDNSNPQARRTGAPNRWRGGRRDDGVRSPRPEAAGDSARNRGLDRELVPFFSLPRRCSKRAAALAGG